MHNRHLCGPCCVVAQVPFSIAHNEFFQHRHLVFLQTQWWEIVVFFQHILEIFLFFSLLHFQVHKYWTTFRVAHFTYSPTLSTLTLSLCSVQWQYRHNSYKYSWLTSLPFAVILGALKTWKRPVKLTSRKTIETINCLFQGRALKRDLLIRSCAYFVRDVYLYLDYSTRTTALDNGYCAVERTSEAST